MRLIVPILSILTASKSSSTITTYNLTESSQGLGVRMPHLDNGTVEYLLQARNSLAPYTLRRDSGLGNLPIGPFSSFADRVHEIMLMPPSEIYPNFRLIESLGNPTPYCFEEAIGMVEMGSHDLDTRTSLIGIDFTVRVSLISNYQAASTPTLIISTGQEQFNLDLVSQYDSIPNEILAALLTEIERLGVTASSTDDANIALLPSIEYTIHRSRSASSDVVARIVLEPQDYFRAGQQGLMIQSRVGFRRPHIGLNTLKHIGVFIDYANGLIGFCEPI